MKKHTYTILMFLMTIAVVWMIFCLCSRTTKVENTIPKEEPRNIVNRLVPLHHSFYGNMYRFQDDLISEHIKDGSTVWEPWLGPLLAKYYVDGTDVLDIGANLGLSSIHMHHVKPVTGTVHLFEPQPDVFIAMSYNVQNLPHKLYHMALGSRFGTGSFPMSNHSPNIGALGLKEWIQGEKRMEVSIVPLDSLVFNNRVSVVKMDVEGSEEEVILGGRQFFLTHKPALEIEISTVKPDNYKRVSTLLESLGYIQVEQPAGADYVFVPKPE